MKTQCKSDLMSKSCDWPGNDPLMIEYHDNEWGVPVHDDRKWFEYILLDTFQAGLSWRTILHKRLNFRDAFDNFDYSKIALYGEDKVEELLSDAGIIRNRLKINATINNARAFIGVREKFGSFDAYIWRFTGGKPIINKCVTITDIPSTSNESDQMSKALKKLGFGFVGSTTCYAFMQAGGMVNDHLVHCFRYREVNV
jgi:DNA-3-methyladenine glycosylase I